MDVGIHLQAHASNGIPRAFVDDDEIHTGFGLGIQVMDEFVCEVERVRESDPIGHPSGDLVIIEGSGEGSCVRVEVSPDDVCRGLYDRLGRRGGHGDRASSRCCRDLESTSYGSRVVTWWITDLQSYSKQNLMYFFAHASDS